MKSEENFKLDSVLLGAVRILTFAIHSVCVMCMAKSVRLTCALPPHSSQTFPHLTLSFFEYETSVVNVCVCVVVQCQR